MRVEQRRACASCGSENAPDAGFCWRCLVPFAPVPPSPGVAPGSPRARVPPAPVSWSPPPQAPGKRGIPPKVVRGIVSIAAAIAVYFGVQYLMGSSLSLPDTLAGRERLSILVDAAAAETTDQLFDALVMGFSQAGAVVDEADARSGTRRGSDYRCVGAVAGTETAIACMWRDDDNVGIVLEMSEDLRATRRLLWTVHDTVVG